MERWELNVGLTVVYVVLMHLLPRDTRGKYRIGMFIAYVAVSILFMWWR